uniref:Uncharacterized protein n=1 Tax=Picea glauca TaxID=3330 RepID=A0A101LVS3_PICGL|nr:hypothetical protein ABT39_MTgene1780 [Picea glauca]
MFFSLITYVITNYPLPIFSLSLSTRSSFLSQLKLSTAELLSPSFSRSSALYLPSPYFRVHFSSGSMTYILRALSLS